MQFLASPHARAASDRLSELLVAVENGDEVTITKHGRPVAKLVPFTLHDPVRIAAAIAEWRELRDKLRLGTGESVQHLITEGRQD